MKKIGIITWFKHENYGTILQAIALQKYLRNNGFNVELINYEINSYKENKFKKFIINPKLFISRVIYHYEKLIHKKDFINKSKKIKFIINNNCVVTKNVVTKEEYIDLCNLYDYLVFGSDQIWNPSWFHPFYYADFDEIKTPRISYAPSIGVTQIPDELVNDYKKALNRFTCISVREKSGVDLLKKYGIKACFVLDPTFLIDVDEYKKLEIKPRNISNKYLLCYFLTDNKNHWNTAFKYAKKNNLDIIIIPNEGFSYIKSANVIKDCSVENFLYLIDHAEYVFTDSFHCTVFSIIFQKNVVPFERHNSNNKISQNSRLYSLLSSLEIDFIIKKYDCKLINNINNIDYNLVNKKLNELKNSSKQYIKDNIK